MTTIEKAELETKAAAKERRVLLPGAVRITARLPPLKGI